MAEFLLKDCDVFYISFDEINADANWDRLLSICANAKRIHGVLGFDKAHRTCALASTTYRFVTIDGDNWLNDGTLEYGLNDTDKEDVCFSFKSRNTINGLEYGNGGIKVWNKTIFLNSATHEKANTTDFHQAIRYYQIDHYASTTVNNCTPYQAWRAGYREGVKMSYINDQPSPDLANHWHEIFKHNLSRLGIWCTIGRDSENGIWAMLGARQALYEQMKQLTVNTKINDYVWFHKKWLFIEKENPEKLATDYGSKLTELGYMVPEIDASTSKWFKTVYINPRRRGLMQ